jgi:hypothetical protein
MEREEKFNRYLNNIIGIIALLALLFLLCHQAKAEESDEHYGNFFTTQPVLEYVFVAANLADMSTTIDIKNHPGLQETNAILGAHPGSGKIYEYFAATTAIHAAITYELVSQNVPKPLVNAWECVSIAYEAGTVGHNLSFGLRFKF